MRHVSIHIDSFLSWTKIKIVIALFVLAFGQSKKTVFICRLCVWNKTNIINKSTKNFNFIYFFMTRASRSIFYFISIRDTFASKVKIWVHLGRAFRSSRSKTCGSRALHSVFFRISRRVLLRKMFFLLKFFFH